MCDTTYWNIKGFNLPHKQNEVQDIVQKEGVKLVSILGIKLRRGNTDQTMNNCLPRWIMGHNYEFHDRGKIWVCWDNSIGVV